LPPKVSIIIVNYNGLKSLGNLLFKCLDSAFNLDYPDYEVIIVDNASTDGSREAILDRYRGDAKIILSNRNRGFTGGNNLGYKYCDPKSKYIVLMNPDFIAYSDSLKIMVKYMEENPSVGELQGILLWMRNPKRIENAGAFVDHFCYVITRYPMEPLNEYPERESYVSYTNGAYMILRRSIIRESLIFPEDFFLYYDDVELGLRLWTYSYKALVIPHPLGEHYSGAITKGSKNPLVLYCDTRNRLTLVKTLWTKFPRLRQLLPFTMLRNMLKSYDRIYLLGFIHGLSKASYTMKLGEAYPLMIVPILSFKHIKALFMGRISYNTLKKTFVNKEQLKQTSTPYMIPYKFST